MFRMCTTHSPFFQKGEKSFVLDMHMYVKRGTSLILLSKEVMVYSTAAWTSSEFLSFKYHDLTPSNLLKIRYDHFPS